MYPSDLTKQEQYLLLIALDQRLALIDQEQPGSPMQKQLQKLRDKVHTSWLSEAQSHKVTSAMQGLLACVL